MNHRALATWLTKKGLQNKNIVLLSCSDLTSAQNLANKLGGTSKVTAWEGAVTVFENGTIKGEGICKEFSPNNVNRVVPDIEIPKGTNVGETGNKVKLGVGGVGKLIDDALANTLKFHPNSSKLGLSVEQIDDFKALLNSKMPNSASDIFGGLKSHLDAGTSFENMQQMVSGLKNNWGNFSDGSKWVFNYTSSSQGLSKFGGKKIRFELPTETELGLRRIDIADVTNPSIPLLYEFKSVVTPFNSTYAIQFVKDLSEANNLSQIKWIYDGSKINNLNKTQILNLIENSIIPQSTINKYLPLLNNPPKSKLIDLLDSEFDNIFKVINL